MLTIAKIAKMKVGLSAKNLISCTTTFFAACKNLSLKNPFLKINPYWILLFGKLSTTTNNSVYNFFFPTFIYNATINKYPMCGMQTNVKLIQKLRTVDWTEIVDFQWKELGVTVFWVLTFIFNLLVYSYVHIIIDQPYGSVSYIFQ